MSLITLYAVRNRNVMEYYKDKALTQLFCSDPYHTIRKSQIRTFEGWMFWCEVVKQ